MSLHAELSATAGATAPWRPPLLVKASVAWHVGAGVAAAALPIEWPWAVGAVALNHVLLTATGLWPRSTWLGPNCCGCRRRRSRGAKSRSRSTTARTPRSRRRSRPARRARRAATFFCIAEQARAQPALCREITRRGHSVQNHSERHSHLFSMLGPRGLADEIGRAQQTLADITGQRPSFFRAPAGLRSPLLAPVLHRLELQLVSWTRRGYDTGSARARPRSRAPDRRPRRRRRPAAARRPRCAHASRRAGRARGAAAAAATARCRRLRPVTLPRAVSTEAVAA
jgi:hypothetical protein